jgi:rhodanese-related sulfurtransferase
VIGNILNVMGKKISTFFSLFTISVLAISCSGQSLPSLPPNEFAEGLKKENVILLDVRTPDEYLEGHLKGAVQIDYRDENFAEQVAELDTTKTVYVYCRSGSRSAGAQELMLKRNFKNVVNLKGGILAWQKAGLPIE